MVVPAVIVIALSAGCRVEQERSGEMPDVDVNVEPGQLPEYEVEGPEVEVGTETETITVPDVDISPHDPEVTPPDFDIELPSDDAE